MLIMNLFFFFAQQKNHIQILINNILIFLVLSKYMHDEQLKLYVDNYHIDMHYLLVIIHHQNIYPLIHLIFSHFLMVMQDLQMILVFFSYNDTFDLFQLLNGILFLQILLHIFVLLQHLNFSIDQIMLPTFLAYHVVYLDQSLLLLVFLNIVLSHSYVQIFFVIMLIVTSILVMKITMILFLFLFLSLFRLCLHLYLRFFL